MLVWGSAVVVGGGGAALEASRLEAGVEAIVGFGLRV